MEKAACGQAKAQGFDERQSAIARADRTCDLARDGDVVAAQDHVEGDQEWTCANHDRTRGLVSVTCAKIRRIFGTGGAAADLLEVHSFGTQSSTLVKENRDR